MMAQRRPRLYIVQPEACCPTCETPANSTMHYMARRVVGMFIASFLAGVVTSGLVCLVLLLALLAGLAHL